MPGAGNTYSRTKGHSDTSNAFKREHEYRKPAGCRESDAADASIARTDAGNSTGTYSGPGEQSPRPEQRTALMERRHLAGESWPEPEQIPGLPSPKGKEVFLY